MRPPSAQPKSKQTLDTSEEQQLEEIAGRTSRQRACKKNIEYVGLIDNDSYFEAQINMGQEEIARLKQG